MSEPSVFSVGDWPFSPPAKIGAGAEKGAFIFAAAFLEHPHIFGQCEGLISAGAGLRWVYDSDPAKVDAFLKRFPGVRVARSFDEILDDRDVQLVSAAGVPCERAQIGARVMEAGKDYFTDKAPFTTLEQLERTRKTVARTGRKYLVYYSERLHVESAVYATQLIREGAIGRVVQVLGLGPHRLNKTQRPAWFFNPAQSGGILSDLASHQFEQFLTYSGATDATVLHSAVANRGNPDHPAFEDFGEASSLGNTGASHYLRVDWFTPAGLRTWGDGRSVILGDKGYIELRKYIEVGQEGGGDQIYLVDEKGEHRFSAAGKVGFPYFGQLILDCQNRTEQAMTQAHAFRSAELALKAQQTARKLGLGWPVAGGSGRDL